MIYDDRKTHQDFTCTKTSHVSNFTCIQLNANKLKQKTILSYIEFASCEVRRLKRATMLFFFSFRAGITCNDTKYAEIPIAPSYDKKTTCYFQQQPLLYSCVSSHPSHIRLCPCRDFIKGQVALCKGCW